MLCFMESLHRAVLGGGGAVAEYHLRSSDDAAMDQRSIRVLQKMPSDSLGLHPQLRCRVRQCDLIENKHGRLSAVFKAVGVARGWYRCAACGIYDDLSRGRVPDPTHTGELSLRCGRCSPRGARQLSIVLPPSTRIPAPGTAGAAEVAGLLAPLDVSDGFRVEQLREEVEAWLLLNGPRELDPDLEDLLTNSPRTNNGNLLHRHRTF